MGVRLALGASRRAVSGRVVRRGVGLAVLGVGAGLVVAAPSTRFISGMLYGVRPLDPGTLVGVTVLLVGVALLACLAPALRVSRMDPSSVLRDD